MKQKLSWPKNSFAVESFDHVRSILYSKIGKPEAWHSSGNRRLAVSSPQRPRREQMG